MANRQAKHEQEEAQLQQQAWISFGILPSLLNWTPSIHGNDGGFPDPPPPSPVSSRSDLRGTESDADNPSFMNGDCQPMPIASSINDDDDRSTTMSVTSSTENNFDMTNLFFSAMQREDENNNNNNNNNNNGNINANHQMNNFFINSILNPRFRKSNSRSSLATDLTNINGSVSSTAAPEVAARRRSGSGSRTGANRPPVHNRNYQEARYKTELCLHFRERNSCPHGARCLFAHGLGELRPYRGRHPKHKTQPCKSFHETGICNYGYRCSYIHLESPRSIRYITSLNDLAQRSRRSQILAYRENRQQQ